MIGEADLQEYLDEIRRHVCSRCVERPEGGPPCAPLGKVCGVELHLPRLVSAVREVHSDWMAPYLDSTRQKVCESCPYLRRDCCPCPMDSLALLVVEAVEAVDRRRQPRGPGPGDGRPEAARASVEEVAGAYEEGAGTWTGCDWPTAFGPMLLDLNGMTAAQADARAAAADDLFDLEEEGVWGAATCWLEEVERRAWEAESEAALAVAAARAGHWDEAAEHARVAWSLEFSTGRPLRRSPPAWQRLYQAAASSARPHGRAALLMAE
jgi:hypothetical protein